MENQRIGETGLSESAHSNHHVPYAVLHGLNHSSISFINQGGAAFGFGGLEEAIVFQGLKINNIDHDDARLPLYSGKPAAAAAATLEIFPSWPLKFHDTPRGSTRSGGGESTGSASAINTISSKTKGAQLEPESPISRNPPSSHQQQHPLHYVDQNHYFHQPQQLLVMPAADSTTPTSCPSPPATKHTPQKIRGAGSTSDRVLDAKTLRRLAQNREAAKKSRIRKKAYLQQLETSRIRLSQIEQDLQLARSQGLLFGGGIIGSGGNISTGAAMFDMEYARWLDDENRHMAELRAGLNTQLSDGDLRFILDGCIAHYDGIFQLKGEVAKSDVFHLINGLWTTPAERCFLWMGGFRPSELIKMLIGQLETLTEQQLMGIYNLKHSSQQAEEALSQGLEQLQLSLIDTIAGGGGSVTDGMHHMVVAIGKLTNLEGFVRQADNLRQQTLHQLPRILTVRQAVRCFLVIGEYYGQLRALSSLWASRPQENMMSEDNPCQTTRDLQMVHQSSHTHFSSF